MGLQASPKEERDRVHPGHHNILRDHPESLRGVVPVKRGQHKDSHNRQNGSQIKGEGNPLDSEAEPKNSYGRRDGSPARGRRDSIHLKDKPVTRATEQGRLGVIQPRWKKGKAFASFTALRDSHPISTTKANDRRTRETLARTLAQQQGVVRRERKQRLVSQGVLRTLAQQQRAVRRERRHSSIGQEVLRTERKSPHHWEGVGCLGEKVLEVPFARGKTRKLPRQWEDVGGFEDQVPEVPFAKGKMRSRSPVGQRTGKIRGNPRYKVPKTSPSNGDTVRARALGFRGAPKPKREINTEAKARKVLRNARMEGKRRSQAARIIPGLVILPEEGKLGIRSVKAETRVSARHKRGGISRPPQGTREKVHELPMVEKGTPSPRGRPRRRTSRKGWLTAYADKIRVDMAEDEVDTKQIHFQGVYNGGTPRSTTLRPREPAQSRRAQESRKENPMTEKGKEQAPVPQEPRGESRAEGAPERARTKGHLRNEEMVRAQLHILTGLTRSYANGKQIAGTHWCVNRGVEANFHEALQVLNRTPPEERWSRPSVNRSASKGRHACWESETLHRGTLQVSKQGKKMRREGITWHPVQPSSHSGAKTNREEAPYGRLSFSDHRKKTANQQRRSMRKYPARGRESISKGFSALEYAPLSGRYDGHRWKSIQDVPAPFHPCNAQRQKCTWWSTPSYALGERKAKALRNIEESTLNLVCKRRVRLIGNTRGKTPRLQGATMSRERQWAPHNTVPGEQTEFRQKRLVKAAEKHRCS